jgi:hypothetical protein
VLLGTVSIHTNAYASRNGGEGSQSSGRAWCDFSADEIGCWLGIVVYMGVQCSPAIADYWKHDRLDPKHPIAEWMSQARFEQIKRYFHVSSPDIELQTLPEDVYGMPKLVPFSNNYRRAHKHTGYRKAKLQSMKL